MLFANGADGVEVGALVVGDVGGVVAEEVEAPFPNQLQERVVAEGAAVNGTADLRQQRGPMAADLVGVVGGLAAEDGRHLVAGRRQLADEPRSRERAAAREEDFHV